MWVDFRRKHLRFIYAPIICLFQYNLSLLRTRMYIKQLVKSFLVELKSSTDRRIRVIYNFADSPHTFGDFMIVVMLCRFLALSGHQVVLTTVDSSRRADWSELKEDTQDRRIVELLDLAKHLLPPLVKVELIHQYRPDPLDINLDSKSFYASAAYFLDLLISKYEWNIPEDFLLGSNSSDTSRPYIAWHLRMATYDARRNLTASGIKNDFKVLQKRFPEHSIMLISDSFGLENAFHALTGSSETKTRKVQGTKVMAQPMPGFQNAVSAVLGASFYFQRGGGGIGVAAIFSAIPYINLCPDKSYFYGRQGGCIMPWSSKNQRYLYVKNDLQSFSIAKLLKKLEV